MAAAAVVVSAWGDLEMFVFIADRIFDALSPQNGRRNGRNQPTNQPTDRPAKAAAAGKELAKGNPNIHSFTDRVYVWCHWDAWNHFMR